MIQSQFNSFGMEAERRKNIIKKTNNNWGNRTQHSKQNIALGCRRKAK